MLIFKDKSIRIILFISTALTAFLALPTLASQVTNNHHSPDLTLVSPSSNMKTYKGLPQKNSSVVLQLGGFIGTQGKQQDIGIEGLVGDHFTVDHRHDQNVLLGIGYYLDGLHKERWTLMYGLNAYYLAHMRVKGNVVQEHIFTNLSYHYSLTNYPIYAAIKALIKTNHERCNMTFDLGIGPNIIRTTDFSENSLDSGFTIPDHAFSGNTNIAFSATAGVGLRLNNILGHVPLEVGYRFFYLGQGYLKKETNQLTDTLKTGNNYANAIVISVFL